MRYISILVFGLFINQAAMASLNLNCEQFNLHFDTPTQVSLNSGSEVASFVFDPSMTNEGFVAYRSARGSEIRISRQLTNGPGERAPIWIENGRAGGSYVCDSELVGE
jgi:hypothetical protein